MQRVAAIDEIFGDEEKHYYDDFKNPDDLAQCMIDADIIYVHSMYRAEEIIDNYRLFGYKIITDLHGVVPEEEDYAGNPGRSQYLASVEAEVFKHCTRFVAVTEAMADYYKLKYKLSRRVLWIVLPIFEVEDYVDENKRLYNSIVYAGGAQRWQNVDLMVDAINRSDTGYTFNIFSHSEEAFKAIEASKSSKVRLRSAPAHQVMQSYKKSDMGFVLRDDIVLNRVACPTKLIEYLSHGVVPIVLSPKIGDFEKLGYQYVTLEEFLAGGITENRLKDAMRANYKVYARLKKQTQVGIARLIDIATKTRSQKKELPSSDLLLKLYISDNNKLSSKSTKIAYLEYQVETQVRMIEEYADAARYYKDELTGLRKSLKYPIKTYEFLKSRRHKLQ